MKEVYQIGIIALLMLTTAAAATAQDTLALETCNAAIRGQVVDRNTGLPLSFAIVELLNFSPRRLVGVTTEGEFVLTCVPVGRQRVRVAAANYNEQIEANILVTTGKEIVLRIELEESVADLRAAAPEAKDVLRPEMLISNNLKINNPYALQGGRIFDIEEVTRYAGSLADPARFAANFTGVYNNNDNQNYIIARGNTPMGVGFRIEGVPLENPNHFAALGNTGANFPILNTNSLARSDFFNGNFTAEYGNATSAMFDMHIRNGNNKKLEFTGQLSLLGAEVMAEGPLKKGKSSFLVAGRYGILGLMQALHLPITTGSSPQYQDLTFKLHFPSVKRGDISVFGVGSFSNVKFLDAEIDSNDVYAERGKDLYIRASLGMAGVNHKKIMGNGKTYISTTLSQSWQQFVSLRDSILPTGGKIDSIYTVNERRAITTLGSFVNSKITLHGARRNTIVSFRSGLRANIYLMDFKDKANYPVERYDYYGHQQLQLHSEAYAQALFKFSEKLSFYAGVYANHFTINKRSWTVEPRLALHWSPKSNHLISLGYSWHSRLVPFIISYNVATNPDGSFDTNNKNLGLFKSQHLSLSHRWQFLPRWQLQGNIYGQYLYNMPISTASNSFSYINYGDFPIFPSRTDLVSEGIGYNAGLELTVIRTFTNGFYATFSGAYSTSKYRGSDNIWRSTDYDIRYLGQALLGREFVFGKLRNNFWTFDLRGNYHYGKPYTPIDTAASALAGRQILQADRANSARLPSYFRFDIKTGLRINRRGLTHYVGLDLINVLGRRNTAQLRYNGELGRVAELSQFGFLPNIIYQVQF